MPELPDVEAFRRYLLAKGLVGRRIEGVELRWPKSVRRPDTETFVSKLRGRRIEALERRAKYLLVPLDQDGTLMIHLRMTGSLDVVPAAEPGRPDVRTVFVLDDDRELRFADLRKLGQLWLVGDPETLVEGLGPEPLLPDLSPDPAFTRERLTARLQGRRAPVKPLLLDQTVAAGVGNIYADEVLFAAGIHPARPAGSLSPDEVARIHEAVPVVLAEATRKLAPLLPLVGPPSESQEAAPALRVPRSEGTPCRRCGALVQRRTISGRSAFFCPHCQPM